MITINVRKIELLKNLIDKYKVYAQGAREHLHANPELSDMEFETSKFIKNELLNMKIPFYEIDGTTAVVGLIEGQPGGNTVALRADMDALPIQEVSDKPYASKNPGVMHACGHDVHMAALLGTAKVLNEMKQEFKGNVKLLFQPAEECDGGAIRMVEAGCLENPHVDYVFGLHVDAEIPCGTLRTKAGAFNASSDTFNIKIKGKKAHGAAPEQGIDSIVTASQIVCSLQSIVSRMVSPTRSAVITVGEFHGGKAQNVICDLVEMSVMVRTVQAEVRESVLNAVRSVVKNTCAIYGSDYEIEETHGYDSMYNNSKCVELIRDVATELLGDAAFSYVEYPFLGCEDFCYFCKDRPGAFYQLGSANEAIGISSHTHSSTYDADPETVANGMLMQAGLVLKILS